MKKQIFVKQITTVIVCTSRIWVALYNNTTNWTIINYKTG